jgi:hypothetical protein
VSSVQCKDFFIFHQVFSSLVYFISITTVQYYSSLFTAQTHFFKLKELVLHLCNLTKDAQPHLLSTVFFSSAAWSSDWEQGTVRQSLPAHIPQIWSYHAYKPVITTWYAQCRRADSRLVQYSSATAIGTVPIIICLFVWLFVCLFTRGKLSPA